MKFSWRQAAGWYHAAAVAVLPWIALWQPSWLPVWLVAIAAGAVVPGRCGPPQPWAGSLQVASGLAAMAVAGGGWREVLAWSAAAAVIGVTRAALGGARQRPDGADAVAAVVWALPFALQPSMFGSAGEGAAAALVVVVGAGSAAARRRAPLSGDGVLAPPSREVRGTLTLRGAVVGGADGLPRTVPLELEIRAGESVAVLHDSDLDAAAFAEVLVGRRAPVDGEVAVDGVTLIVGDRLAALVARGEPMVRGSLSANLAALCEAPLPAGTEEAVREACGLEDAQRDLGTRSIAADGAPLAQLDRALVMAARVVPSDYRLMVVVDPVPWVNAVRAELWRSAVVRASLGRTAVWCTSDVDLARRADRVYELRHGSLGLRDLDAPGVRS